MDTDRIVVTEDDFAMTIRVVDRVCRFATFSGVQFIARCTLAFLVVFLLLSNTHRPGCFHPRYCGEIRLRDDGSLEVGDPYAPSSGNPYGQYYFLHRVSRHGGFVAATRQTERRYLSFVSDRGQMLQDLSPNMQMKIRRAISQYWDAQGESDVARDVLLPDFRQIRTRWSGLAMNFVTVSVVGVLLWLVIIPIRLAYVNTRRNLALEQCRCPECGYDIRLLPDCRCPECGGTWNADAIPNDQQCEQARH